jgi:pimeloyl-ACP methyl ester carboxylesterase
MRISWLAICRDSVTPMRTIQDTLAVWWHKLECKPQAAADHPRVGHMTRRCFAILLLIALASTAVANQPVPPFPATPVLPRPAGSGYIAVDGVKLWYAEFGNGPPVMLVEGGLDTRDDWAYLAPELAAHGYRAIVFDTRCQGRSTCGPAQLSYRLMARDTVALMTALHVKRAPFVGYSDGGIIGLEVAIHDPGSLVSLFAYGANSNPGTLAPLSAAQKEVEADSAAWSKRVYEQSSPTPNDFPAVARRIERLWDTQPHLTAAQFGTILRARARRVGSYPLRDC